MWMAVAAGLGGLILGAGSLFVIEYTRKRSAKQEAERIIKEAEKDADRIIKDAKLAAREEMVRLKDEFNEQVEQRTAELKGWEERLVRREELLERKTDIVSKKEGLLDKKEATLSRKEKELQQQEQYLEYIINREKEVLHQISGVSREEAVNMLLERIEKEADREVSERIQKITERMKEEIKRKATNMLVEALQRCAVESATETTVATVELPADEMKGRIIGREGRNIRAFEKATGADVIVDDTPGVVVVSCFESVRREIARRAMEKLVTDGRIHPARIEEVVKETEMEMQKEAEETGRAAAMEMGIHNLHPRLLTHLGRLKYRYSYGQNVLQHCMETAGLMGLIAGELGLDVKLAKRCGLLHDIGKAFDHEEEGSHAYIGADLAKRCGESEIVVNAIAAHHEEVPYNSMYAALTHVMDAVSGSRPGARRETLERYIERLEKLESIALSFDGVEKSFAIQAGREVRVIVDASRVDDAMAAKIAWDVARQVEQELSYPGEVKVMVIRETRVEETARHTTGKRWGNTSRRTGGEEPSVARR